MLGIEKIVVLYRKMEMSIISNLSGMNENVIDETTFYDIGYIQTHISRIQKLMKEISNELEMYFEIQDKSEREKKHIQELIEQREHLLFRMVFLASNSFKNLEDCVKLAEGYNFKFMVCVQALAEYNNGNKEKALQLLGEYYKQHGYVKEHYLVNKVFGILLVENEMYNRAIVFLDYALQLMPDDIECLKNLKKCYEKLNEKERESVIIDILSVLE